MYLVLSLPYFPLLVDRLINGEMNLLPVTVVAAIFLFFLRELVDLFKKRSDIKRNIEAIKLLIADEIEKNHWSLVSMFRVLTSLKEDFESNDNAVHQLRTARNGSEHFESKGDPTEGFFSSQPIPKFHTVMYEKLIQDIAALDKDLFFAIHSTYEEINELIHYRDSIIDYLSGEESPLVSMVTKDFFSDFVEEENDYYGHLNKTYKLLKNKELKTWKLR